MDPRLPSVMTSPDKVAHHEQRVKNYLSGEPIYPVTVELDVTSECNKACGGCPSADSQYHSNLDGDFLQRLFESLEGNVKGLLLSGGEPTLSPLFPRTLRLARQAGVAEIAVVTNGSFLDRPEVAQALVTDATAVRVSAYGWQGPDRWAFHSTLRNIQELRRRIDAAGSVLQIGVSLLTASVWLEYLPSALSEIEQAGAHWIYLHPLCHGWGSLSLNRADQSGVLETVDALRDRGDDAIEIHLGSERYEHHDIIFNAYHASHFLLVVGADGKNYLGTEVKYHKQYEIADLRNGMGRGFLWKKERLQTIQSVNNANYALAGGRHRGVLYNGLIERIRQGTETWPAILARTTGREYLHANIL